MGLEADPSGDPAPRPLHPRRSTFYNDLLRLDTTQSPACWELMPEQLPFAPRAHHTALLVDNSIWVIGGSDNTEVYGDVWQLDLKSTTWRAVQLSGPAELLQRCSHAADLHPGNTSAIVIFGGYGDLVGSGEPTWLGDLLLLHTDQRRVEVIKVGWG